MQSKGGPLPSGCHWGAMPAVAPLVGASAPPPRRPVLLVRAPVHVVVVPSVVPLLLLLLAKAAAHAAVLLPKAAAAAASGRRVCRRRRGVRPAQALLGRGVRLPVLPGDRLPPKALAPVVHLGEAGLKGAVPDKLLVHVVQPARDEGAQGHTECRATGVSARRAGGRPAEQASAALPSCHCRPQPFGVKLLT